MVHLFGIESPGLTASLAIGDYVVNLLRASRTEDRGQRPLLP
jgi:L-2-hydroxyglutarate oxidase LhgO